MNKNYTGLIGAGALLALGMIGKRKAKKSAVGEINSTNYEVGLWNGSGYHLTTFQFYADSEEEALEKAVAFIERHPEYHYLFADEDADIRRYELEQEGFSDYEIDEQLEPEYIYIDATMEGARNPHYIFGENLLIRKIKY